MNDIVTRLQTALASWQEWSATLSKPPLLVDQLDGGLSHNSYLLDAGGQKLVLRLEDPQSRALAMAREWELQAMKAAANTAHPSLAPRILWNDEFTLVTEFIHGQHWMPMNDLEGLCQSLKTLHELPIALPTFDLLGHCDSYWREIQLQQASSTQDQALYLECRQQLAKTLENYPEQCLCHNDLNPANIFCHTDGFTFIDWEYACFNSPYFELATLVEFFALDDRQRQQLSDAYWRLQPQSYQNHLAALTEFQLVVRLVEWLWLSLKQPHLRQGCEARLLQLLAF